MIDLSAYWDKDKPATGWVTAADDPRATILKAEGRGEPGDAFYQGGWRCAGRIWNQHGDDPAPDHLVSLPFYVSEGDPRHNIYCERCAVGMGVPK